MLSNVALILAAVAAAPAVLAQPIEPAANVSPRPVDLATLWGIVATEKAVRDVRSDTAKMKRQNPGNIWACDNIGFQQPCSAYSVPNGQWFNIEGLSLNNRISSIGSDWGANCWAWDHFDANGCWNENGTPALDITYPGLRDLTSLGWNDKIGCIKCNFWA
ncbi:hypothetical protein CABS01_12095 [Colletotrichum abscissum]|uniref:Uncharacterized protein n=2 Tax=Colletotrichum acutatum species complex TaxID=2707335 RepID=A0A9P9XFZ6_9PEZI|nr:uncharacterized protein CTAM01_09729 [Colletotrichum tamarilloi]XP_060396965.1 uncharacterized protein CABS01_12095 [Colletotrichum abscissum]KAI3553507.1 hypothetical protein CABS02_06379 [Colletotrichum abscissum]KAK1491771.1 hypothetical protein CABS01_12095 [Colletotrichum abscissum]KAK1492778.1 hypothetical protein CTAM01_09729 [Colletotrichum tamarilloi]